VAVTLRGRPGDHASTEWRRRLRDSKFRAMCYYYLRVRSISKRFRPNRRASIDQAPGPSIARLAGSTARKTRIHVSPWRGE